MPKTVPGNWLEHPKAGDKIYEEVPSTDGICAK